MALPVSCVAGAMTRGAPRSFLSSGKTAPRSVPLSTTWGSIDIGSATASSTSVAQRLAIGSQHWVVVALVRSEAKEPLSHEWNRSGIMRSRCACANAPGCSCSWADN